MDIIAFVKSTQIAPRKVRLVADSIRKQSVNNALVSLSATKKRGADVLEKTLRSAIANAIDRKALKENLFIKSIDVSEGPSYKRFHPSTRGRAHPYKKRKSHIRITLSDEINSKVKVKSSKVEKKEENKQSLRPTV